MSIIIKALNKLERHTKNSEKNRIRKLLGLSGKRYRVNRLKRSGFVLGLMAGIGFMVIASGVMLVFLNRRSAQHELPQPISQPSSIVKVTRQPVEPVVDVPFNTSISAPEEVVDTVMRNSAPNLDIDRELLLDDIKAHIDDYAISEVLAEYQDTPPPQLEPVVRHTDLPDSAENAQPGLPELEISGVVWDYRTRYVYINGIPLQEQESINGVLIKKILYSHLIVLFNDKEYEIVLQ